MSGVKRRMVCGVGYDSKGGFRATYNSKPTKIYAVWRNMIERCYNPKQLARRETYISCTVDERWHDFQDFAAWYDAHPYSEAGYELDKDILVKGNKIYSPETCCLVHRDINMMFTNTDKNRGKYPQGVSYYKPLDKFCARVCVDGKAKHLGYFETPEQAHKAFKVAKENHVKLMADRWFGSIEPKVYEALMDWNLES